MDMEDVGPSLKILDCAVKNGGYLGDEIYTCTYDLFRDARMLRAIFDELLSCSATADRKKRRDDVIDNLFMHSHGRKSRRVKRSPVSSGTVSDVNAWIDRLKERRPPSRFLDGMRQWNERQIPYFP